METYLKQEYLFVNYEYYCEMYDGTRRTLHYHGNGIFEDDLILAKDIKGVLWGFKDVNYERS